LGAEPGKGGPRTPVTMVNESDGLIQRSKSDSRSDENEKQSSLGQTFFNFTNIFIGLGLLSQPYALSQGGWISLFILLKGTVMCHYTAKLVAKVTGEYLKKRPDGVPSYAEIGRLALGSKGYVLGSMVVLTELFFGTCISMVFVWNSVQLLLAQPWAYPYTAIACWSIIVMLPTVWIKSFSRMAFIAVMGTAASFGVFIVVVVSFALSFSSSHALPSTSFVEPSTISIAYGIYLTSLGGHCALPSLYSQLDDDKKHKFGRIITLSFLSLFLLYSAMAIFGYVTFGDATQVIITSSLAIEPGPIVAKIAAAAVIFASWANLSPFTSVMSDILFDILSKSGTAGKKSSQDAGNQSSIPLSPLLLRPALFQASLRSFLFILCFGLALLTFPFLNLILSFSGGIMSMLDSIILPPLFYLSIFSSRLSRWEKAFAYYTIAFGVISSLFITTSNIIHLIQ